MRSGWTARTSTRPVISLALGCPSCSSFLAKKAYFNVRAKDWLAGIGTGTPFAGGRLELETRASRTIPRPAPFPSVACSPRVAPALPTASHVPSAPGTPADPALRASIALSPLKLETQLQRPLVRPITRSGIQECPAVALKQSGVKTCRFGTTCQSGRRRRRQSRAARVLRQTLNPDNAQEN